MWKLFLSWLVVKTGLRSLGWLAALIPFAFLLKTVGAPLLAILATLGLPLLIILAVIGLPIIVVLVFTGVLLAIVAAVLSLGLAVAKVVVPIVLVWWLVSWLFRGAWWNDRGKKGEVPLTGDVKGPDGEMA